MTAWRGLTPPRDDLAATAIPMCNEGNDQDLKLEPPPFGGSWRRLYAIVVGALVVEIALFALFTAVFR